MTLYIRNPELMAESSRRMMRKLFDTAFNSEKEMLFLLGLKANKDEYKLTAMLPGLTAEDIAITFDNGILTIDAEYSETREEDSEYLFSELPVGKFTRSVRIDENILIDKIEASMKDGVLTIKIPKAEESKPKNIKVITR